jgi:hypothetical protein
MLKLKLVNLNPKGEIMAGKKKVKSLIGWMLYGSKQVGYFDDEFQPSCLYHRKKDVPIGSFARELKAYKVRITIEEIK